MDGGWVDGGWRKQAKQVEWQKNREGTRRGVHVGPFIIKPWYLHMHKLLCKKISLFMPSYSASLPQNLLR